MGKWRLIFDLWIGLFQMADAMEMMLLSLLVPALICEWQISSYEQVDL